MFRHLFDQARIAAGIEDWALAQFESNKETISSIDHT